MSTTTIRLTGELKDRIDRLAAAAGKSTHALMLDTLSEGVDLMERRLAFEAEAERRWAEYQRTGEYISHDDLFAYAKALAAGKKPARPKVRNKDEPARRVAKRA